MQYIDSTLPTPPQNLACDEALIDLCEDGYDREILRFWEPPDYFEVLGYSNRIRSEVNLPSCRTNNVPVLRRCSGGGTVLQGPGCLNYALILRIPNSGPLKSITDTNASITKRHLEALEPIVGGGVKIQGLSDLVLGGLKFSGNAQYRRRRFLLFHGTFLLHFDIALVEKLLPLPPRQSPYRRNRSHRDFLTNLKVPSYMIKEALKRSWNATVRLRDLPSRRIDELVAKRYSREEWNFKF
ncbi:MAG: biotin/lipoate A/B protein ligase family protein [Candidatus Binatia bacterium]